MMPKISFVLLVTFTATAREKLIVLQADQVHDACTASLSATQCCGRIRAGDSTPEYFSQHSHPSIPQIFAHRSVDALQESWILSLGSLSLIPFLPNTKKAVDLGCGTGIWIRTMAPQHPETSFIGIDINPPIERKLLASANGNCRFVKADTEGDWDFIDAPHSVDYFLACLLTTGIRDWQGLYHKAFSAATTPGGYFESQEAWIGLGSDDDGKYKDLPAMRWFNYLADFAQGNGVETDSIDKHAERLQTAGFTVGAEKPIIKYLDASRPEMKGRERISILEIEQISDIIDGMTPRLFAKSMTISPDEGRKVAAEAKEDLRGNSGRHGYHTRKSPLPHSRTSFDFCKPCGSCTEAMLKIARNRG